jgi:hypothetical protein
MQFFPQVKVNSLGLVAVVAVAVFACGLVGGCTSEPKDPFKEWGAAQRLDEFVPMTAQSVQSGNGTLTYTTPSNGVLYLLDTTSKVMVKNVEKPRVVVAGYVPSGTEVIFNPQEKRIHAKGKPGIKLTNVTPDHTHELRFDASTANPKAVTQ